MQIKSGGDELNDDFFREEKEGGGDELTNDL
jgi:hypothetical protein